MVCNVELCSLTFRPQIFSKENIVSSSLFGDGSISYIVAERGNCKILNSMEHTWKDSLNLMGWGVEDDGLSVIFDKIIPEFITKNFHKLSIISYKGLRRLCAPFRWYENYRRLQKNF